MNNLISKTVALAKYLCEPYINENSIVVDATCGNGNDTLYYAQRCRFVYGIDLQKEAIDQTNQLLQQHQLTNYQLFLGCHSQLASYINQPVDLILFNLGYLPRGDHNITTEKQTTLPALLASLDLIKVNGLICLVLYYGHPQGKAEREAVLQFVHTLDRQQYHVLHCSSCNQKNDPPEILLITKKR